MPKNKGKGGKSFRSGKKHTESDKRELVKREGEDLDYGIIVSVLGGAKVQVKILRTNELKMGFIRGPIYKREWIVTDDIVLISLRDFEQSKCDIVWKYNEDEIRQLQKLNEIPMELGSKEDSPFDYIGFDENESDNNTNTIDHTSTIQLIDDDFIDGI